MLLILAALVPSAVARLTRAIAWLSLDGRLPRTENPAISLGIPLMMSFLVMAVLIALVYLPICMSVVGTYSMLASGNELLDALLVVSTSRPIFRDAPYAHAADPVEVGSLRCVSLPPSVSMLLFPLLAVRLWHTGAVAVSVIIEILPIPTVAPLEANFRDDTLLAIALEVPLISLCAREIAGTTAIRAVFAHLRILVGVSATLPVELSSVGVWLGSYKVYVLIASDIVIIMVSSSYTIDTCLSPWAPETSLPLIAPLPPL